MPTLEERVAALEKWNSIQKAWNKAVNRRQDRVETRQTTLETEVDVLAGKIASGGGTGTTIPPEDPDPLPEDPVDATTHVNLLAYGPAWQIDSKINFRPGVTGKIAFRFIASHSSAVTNSAIAERTGPGYSAGAGATWRRSIQAEVSGAPSGTRLCELTHTVASTSVHAERYPVRAFTSPSAALVAGNPYYLVIEHVGGSPSSNHASVNGTINWNAGSPRQPAYTDAFGVVGQNGGAWGQDNYGDGELVMCSPVFDITYANGGHDGVQFNESMVASGNPVGQHIRRIGGSANHVRERFTAGRSFSATGVRMRVRRHAAGDGTPLTIEVQNGSGTVLKTGTVAATAAPLDGRVDGWGTSGYMIGYDFDSPLTITSGQEYRIVGKCAGTTDFRVVPLRSGQVAAGFTWGSWRFAEGIGEFTTNGGSSWAPLYSSGHEHAASYLVVAP